MPIYEYACPDCQHQAEHLQKMSAAPLTTCPQCGGHRYYKKVSAAGFALKGTGWYATDFKGTPKPAADRAEAASAPAPAPTAAPAPAPAAGA